MKNPAPGVVIRSAIRFAAWPAPNGVAELLSSSKVSSTTTLTPPVGMLGANAFMKLTVPPVPNTVGSSEKTSVAVEKLMKFSPPTICRPGVFRTFVPANGSVSKVNVVACAVEHITASAIPTQYLVRLNLLLLWNKKLSVERLGAEIARYIDTCVFLAQDQSMGIEKPGREVSVAFKSDFRLRIRQRLWRDGEHRKSSCH